MYIRTGERTRNENKMKNNAPDLAAPRSPGPALSSLQALSPYAVQGNYSRVSTSHEACAISFLSSSSPFFPHCSSIAWLSQLPSSSQHFCCQTELRHQWSSQTPRTLCSCANAAVSSTERSTSLCSQKTRCERTTPRGIMAQGSQLLTLCSMAQAQAEPAAEKENRGSVGSGGKSYTVLWVRDCFITYRAFAIRFSFSCSLVCFLRMVSIRFAIAPMMPKKISRTCMFSSR